MKPPTKQPPAKKPQAPIPNDFDRLTRQLRSYVGLARTAMPYILPSPHALEERYGIQSFKTNWEWRIFDRPLVSFSTEWILAMHLAGVIVLAAPFDGDVRYIEIDLDAKDKITARTLRERAQIISRIFERGGNPTGIMWGSSACGGLRFRIPLDRPHDARMLRERTLDLLHRNGLKEQRGLVEVFPHGGCFARLPLGRGSTLCDEAGGLMRVRGDDNRLRYLGAKLVRGDVRRIVPEMVHTWTDLVESRRNALATLFGAPPSIFLPLNVSAPPASTSCTPLYEEKNEVGFASREEVAWTEHMAGLYANGAPRGGRFDAAGNVVFDLRVAQGLSEEDAFAEYAKWLNGPHESRDLTGPKKERVKRQMLHDARAQLARLGREIAAGTLVPGGGSARSSATIPLLSTRKERDTFGKDWRAVLLRDVPAHLVPALATMATDRRLHDALSVLASLVARYRRDNPSTASIAIHVGLLKTIMGGGTRKWKLRNGKDAAPYRVLLEAAQRMGILGAVVGAPSVTAHVATIYRLP